MRTDVVALSNKKEESFVAMMEVAEKVVAYYELPVKKAMQLRLLCEELANMLPELLYFAEGSFYIDGENKNIELHVNLKAINRTDMNKDRIIAASADKKNSAKGIINRLTNVISSFFEGQETADEMGLHDPAFLNMNAMDTYPGGYWSLGTYMDSYDESEAEEPWDELEKSIIIGIADDVKVGIVDKKVEIVVKKNFA